MTGIQLVLHLCDETAQQVGQDPDRFAPPNAPSILFQVAGELLERGCGLQPGEVIGPRGRLFDQGE
jgi:hypothetical protein